MADARGLSHLYPVVPIMNFLSMVLLLLLVPGFWKTRIVALVSHVGWIFIGNLLSFIGMVHWRGRTNDSPVWATILTILWRTWVCGFFTSIACFAHFTWQRLQPLPARQLYDTRRRNNLIHLFLSLILPVLWAPLFLLSCPHRYMLIEDFGPDPTVRTDWPGFVVFKLPALLSYVTIVIFNVLALVRYWHAKQEDIESDPSKHRPSVRTRKFLLMACMNTPLAVYGIYNQFIGWGNAGFIPTRSLAENINSLQLVLTVTRIDLDTSFQLTARVRIITAVALPLLGFNEFAWFGFGEESRKAYREGVLKFVRLLDVADTLPFSWSAIALRRAKSRQGVVDPFPFVQIHLPHITPYISPLPREHGPQLPTSPTRMRPSNPVGNVFDNKPRAPAKEPTRRQSTHKPHYIPLYPANATTDLVPKLSARRLSSHKPPFVPLDPKSNTVDSVPNHRRRLSHHKPAFAHLDSANAILNTTCDPLGSMRQHARVQMMPQGSRVTGLPAYSTVDAPLLPLPTSSTYLAQPPLYPCPATPVPPYQDGNPFAGGTP